MTSSRYLPQTLYGCVRCVFSNEPRIPRKIPIQSVESTVESHEVTFIFTVSRAVVKCRKRTPESHGFQ